MCELVENRLYANADDSTPRAVVRKPADRPAVAASLSMDLTRIQEWCNHWYMILNPNKTKVLVVSRSWTVNPPHGDLVLSGVSIRASSNLDILYLAWSLTANSSLKTMCVVLFSMSIRELVFWGWWSVYLCTPLCYYVAILHLFSQSLIIALRCGGLLLNIIFSFSSTRCIQWPGFALIMVSCRCVIDVVLLGLVYIVQG